MAILEIENLSAFYGKAQALDGVSFSVEEGEIVGVIGANGAGKSTLLRVCAGLLRIESGTAEVLGHDLSVDLAW